jgi:hypothetical protein
VTSLEYVWLAAGAVIAGLEGYGIYRHERGVDTPDDTVTEFARRVIRRWPFASIVAWGWLTYHFFIEG